MTELGTLVSVGLAFWFVAASPGPANIANSVIAMKHGRKTSLKFGLGLSVALTFWGVLAATGMGALLQASVGLLFVLKLFGALYLFWLAWQSAKSATRPKSLTVLSVPAGNWFLRGLMLNMSNPKSVIAWMAALSVGLDPTDTTGSVVTATSLCIVIAFANNVSYSLVFSLNGMMAAYQRARRWIDGIVSGLFAMAGFALLRSAFSR
ncbi:MAG: LysE family translocator [Rhodobacteraceae bacterium]|nr:LysE family translocator [Paracoccaceae bacterium]